MKVNFCKAVIFGVIYAFFMFLFLPHLNAYNEEIDRILYDPEITISMDLQNASIKDILKIFSIQSGLNFIASEAVRDRTVTLYMDKVPLEEAMNQLFKANNLSYDLDRDANIFIVKDWGKTTIETVTRVFYLKYASVSSSRLEQEKEDYLAGTEGGDSTTSESSDSSSDSENGTEEENTGITNAVKKLLSSEGQVMEDPRTNSLIVTDTPNRISVITQVIAALDVSVPQVMLEVEMLDVEKNAIDQLGMDWSNAGAFAMTVISAARMTGFPLGQVSHMAGATIPTKVTNASTKGGATDKYNVGEINFPNNLAWVFNYLKTLTDTRILARPRIMTLNNETAEIKITSREAIGTVQTASSGGALTTETTEAERAETGVLLRVTPQVNLETGEITMLLIPKVANATASSTFTSGDTVYLDPEERTTKSLVRVKDGETVILGGLIHKDMMQTVYKVPFLGDIPFLGTLFKYTNKSKDVERELLVFITPHIIKDRDMQLAQAANTSLPEREQSTASGASRESLINAHLNRFEKKKR